MILRFHYEGNTPSKKNQKKPVLVPRKDKKTGLMKTRMLFVPSTAHEIWHKEALWRMTLQKSAIATIRFPLPRCKQVLVKLYFEDRRRRDSSNTFESIMDLLVDAGILADDCWAITGATMQFPFLRAGRPGWEAFLDTGEPAPGPSAVHRNAPPPEAPAV